VRLYRRGRPVKVQSDSSLAGAGIIPPGVPDSSSRAGGNRFALIVRTSSVNSAVRQFFVLGLLFATVVVLFIAAESGQRQLAAASRRVEKAAAREHALATVRDILSRAESGQRGYILLGDDAYLAQYQDGLEKLPASLELLTREFADADSGVRTDVTDLARLSHVKFQEMNEILALYRDR